MTALLLLAPGTPMLFQGQEFAASSPVPLLRRPQPGAGAAGPRRAGASSSRSSRASSRSPSGRDGGTLPDPGSPGDVRALQARPRRARAPRRRLRPAPRPAAAPPRGPGVRGAATGRRRRRRARAGGVRAALLRQMAASTATTGCCSSTSAATCTCRSCPSRCWPRPTACVWEIALVERGRRATAAAGTAPSRPTTAGACPARPPSCCAPLTGTDACGAPARATDATDRDMPDSHDG